MYSKNGFGVNLQRFLPLHVGIVGNSTSAASENSFKTNLHPWHLDFTVSHFEQYDMTFCIALVFEWGKGT